MAQFKVGQRVRIIADPWDSSLIGREATIAGRAQMHHCRQMGDSLFSYRIAIDGLGTHAQGRGHYIAAPAWLAPLTDPRADAFLESIKKIAREPNNIVAKEKA